MAGLSTSTLIWSESAATSLMSCSFWRQRSPATSSCENTTSLTGPAMRWNSLRTASSSRDWRMAMPHYIVAVEEPRDEAFRDQSLRTHGLSLQLFPEPRLLRLRDARSVRGGDPTRLRGEGADGDRHRHAPGVGRVPRPLRPAARSRAGPLLGQPLRADDVREAPDALARRAAHARRRLPADLQAVGARRAPRSPPAGVTR